eukprot:4377631-Pyramimonas_sp.AAC.1
MNVIHGRVPSGNVALEMRRKMEACFRIRRCQEQASGTAVRIRLSEQTSKQSKSESVSMNKHVTQCKQRRRLAAVGGAAHEDHVLAMAPWRP